MPVRRAAGLAFLAMVVATPLAAADYEQFTADDGTVIDYAVVRPADFETGTLYPTILALPPGPQNIAMVDAGLQSYWEVEARRRGFLVVSPAAPGGQLFFRGSEILIPAFLAHVRATLPVAPGGIHLTGISNGGLSAFRIALAHPEMFASLTVLPGMPPSEQEFDRLDALDGMVVNMFVGERDTAWRNGTEATAAALDRLGHPIHVEILPGEGHVMQTIAGSAAARIFDLLPE